MAFSSQEFMLSKKGKIIVNKKKKSYRTCRLYLHAGDHAGCKNCEVLVKYSQEFWYNYNISPQLWQNYREKKENMSF